MQKKTYEGIGECIFEDTLENGLRLRVVPKKGFSSFYAAIAPDYGGAHRRFETGGKMLDTPAGVAHFLEHKMFDLPNGDNALNLLSANGADPNAFTSSDMTCYYFQCTRGFEENLRMLLHVVSTPYFTKETVQKEQGIIAQEIRMCEDNPGIAIYYDLLKLLYAHHPVRDQVAGTVESIADITAETLYDCHRVFYAPSNMVLCVEGDVDPERIAAIAREELPKERSAVPHADFGEDEGLMPAEREHTSEMAVSAPQFLFGAKLEQKDGDVLRQRLTAQLSLRLLLGSSSPFYTRLYADGTLSHDFDYETDYSAGTATVIIGGESREPEKVLRELNAEVASVRENGLDEERFQRAKRASLGAHLRGLEDFESVCLSVVSGVFDGYEAFDAVSMLDAVEKRECEEFIVRNLAPERIAVSIVTPKKE